MEVPSEIIENTIIDWRKKDIPKDQKALLIKKYLDETGMSQGKLAEKLGVAKGTLHDWLHPEKRGVARKYDVFSYEALIRFTKYVDTHEKRFNHHHLEDIKKLIKRLEDIKNKIEVERIQGDL